MPNQITSATKHPTKKHPVDICPGPAKLGVLSLQHVLAFYAGAVVVPLVVAGGLKLDAATTIHLINADLLTCGIATLIQSVGFWKVGTRLPIVQGVTTTALSPMIAIGLTANPEGGVESLPLIYGAIIVSGIFTFLCAPLFAKFVRFFPPLVIGIVLTTMGVTLLSVSASDITNWVAVGADGHAHYNPIDFAYAMGTLLTIIIIQRFFKGFFGTIAVLVGLIAGTTVSTIFGHASFSEVGNADWFQITTPFYFGLPKFGVAACISMIIVMIITMVETTGDVFATGEIVGKRITKDHIAAALRADGLSTALGGVMNSFPYTCFAQNIGLVRLTKVSSRWVVAASGVIMLVLGVLPKAGAIVASIPHPVLGGASLALFANLTLVGIQTLSRVDLSDTRNGVILTTSIGMAMLVAFKPDVALLFPEWAQIFFASGVTVGSIIAISMNLLFHHVGRSKGEDVAVTPTGKRISLEEVNQMSQDQFVEVFSFLFNGETWPLKRISHFRPFKDVGEFKEAIQDSILSAEIDRQNNLLQDYPDVVRMLLVSEEEAKGISQDVGSIALGQINVDDEEQLVALSEAYQNKFAMPLIACLERMDSVDQIIKDGLHRLENSPKQERLVALGQIVEIANDRFDIMLADANPVRSAWARKFEQLK